MAYCPHYRPALLWFLEKYEPLFAYCLCLQAHLYVLIYDMIWYVCTCWEHEKGMDRFLFYRLHKIVIVFITANWEPVMWFRIKLMVYSSNKSYDAHSHTGLNTHFSLNPSFAVTVPPPITSLLEQYSNLSFESPFSPSFLSSHCIRICVSAHVTHFSFAYEIFYDWLNYELFSYKFR